MTKFIKCIVKVSRLRIEEFDSVTGEPISSVKNDWNGAEYVETKEVTYLRGAEVAFPEAVVKKLGRSVEVMMTPMVMEAVVVPAYEAPEGAFKDESDENTVANLIPKDPPKGKGGKGGKGNK